MKSLLAEHTFPHAECKYHINEYYIGFRMITPRKGDTYAGRKSEFQSLIFLLEGEVEFSYDDFLNHIFRKGDMFFVPQGAHMYGTSLADSHMMVLTFNNNIDSLCDNCTLSNYIKHTTPIDYDFRALKMNNTLLNFVRNMEEYINNNMRCAYLHKLKQRELFILMQYCYTRQQILELFFPVVGSGTDFRSWVLENYKIDVSMRELAQRCNMYEKTFSRKFKREFGTSFRDWMLKQKAKQVKLKLSIPRTTFSDIVREYKFADMSHFYRFCKEQYGCTAIEFQKTLRGE